MFILKNCEVMKLILKIVILIVGMSYTVHAQHLNEQLTVSSERKQPFDVTYKIIDSIKLDLTFRYPPDFKKTKKYPAIIFFFGGGWNGGTTEQFKPHAEYLSSRGMIAVLADYRVKSRHNTTPYEAVADAKSAIRFLRMHAKKLNIDTDKIVASGGSAGGHLAAACGTLQGLDESNEDLSISSKANALVLFNPVFDNGPGGYGHERLGERWMEISPAHNIKEGAPPTIVFLGTEDHLIPVSIAENYKAKMEEVGGRCDLFLYEGEGHGFFNKSKKNGEYYKKTVHQTDLFLKSLSYLRGKPKI
jgi:acetyl esterase/lipase